MATKKTTRQPIITSHQVDVDPAEAARLLGTNSENNRLLHKDTVARYARDMRLGQWMLGEPILIDWNGVLIDGQHRLEAIIKAEITVPLVIVEGVDPEIRLRLNTGKPRNPQDALRVAGIDVGDPAVVCAIARMDMSWERGALDRITASGSGHGEMAIENWDYPPWVTAHPGCEGLADRGRRGALGMGVRPSVFGFACLLFEQKGDPETLRKFEDQCAAITYDVNGKPPQHVGDDPVIQLAETIRHENKIRRETPRKSSELAMLILCWNRLRGYDLTTESFHAPRQVARWDRGAAMPQPE